MVMDVALKYSPENIIGDWGALQDFAENGASAAPTGWVATGTAGSIARESTIIKYGVYSTKIISGASGSYALEYNYKDFSLYAGRTIKFGCWVFCGTASKARIYIKDGLSATANSSFHTGNGTWQFLETTLQVDPSNTRLSFGIECVSATITAYFSGGVAVEGETIFSDLRGANIYVRSEEVEPSIDVRFSSYAVPRREGSFIDNVQFEERKFTFRAQLHGSTYAEARGYVDTLTKTIYGRKIDYYTSDQRILKAFATQIPRLRYLANFNVNLVDVQMTAPNASEQYISRTRKKVTVSSSPNSFSIPYLGNVSSYPIFSFVPTGATLSSCVLENLTTGERFAYTGSAAVGITIEINSELTSVKKDLADDISNWTGDWIKLVPGTNYFKFTGDNNVLRVDWYDRWL